MTATPALSTSDVVDCCNLSLPPHPAARIAMRYQGNRCLLIGIIHSQATDARIARRTTPERSYRTVFVAGVQPLVGGQGCQGTALISHGKKPEIRDMGNYGRMGGHGNARYGMRRTTRSRPKMPKRIKWQYFTSRRNCPAPNPRPFDPPTPVMPSAAQFRRNNCRDDRRRRLLADEFVGAGSKTVSGGSDAVGIEHRSQNYGDAEFFDEQPRLFELIPRRLWAIGLAGLAGIGVVVGLLWLHGWTPVASSGQWTGRLRPGGQGESGKLADRGRADCGGRGGRGRLLDPPLQDRRLQRPLPHLAVGRAVLDARSAPTSRPACTKGFNW